MIPSANSVLNKCVSVVVHPIGTPYDFIVILFSKSIVSKKTSCSTYTPDKCEPSAYLILKEHLLFEHLEEEANLHLVSPQDNILEFDSKGYLGFKCSPHDSHKEHGDVVIELPVSRMYT